MKFPGYVGNCTWVLESQSSELTITAHLQIEQNEHFLFLTQMFKNTGILTYFKISLVFPPSAIIIGEFICH